MGYQVIGAGLLGVGLLRSSVFSGVGLTRAFSLRTRPGGASRRYHSLFVNAHLEGLAFEGAREVISERALDVSIEFSFQLIGGVSI